MGTTEFNAATYYRYSAVNLSMLADKDHLASNRRVSVMAGTATTHDYGPYGQPLTSNGSSVLNGKACEDCHGEYLDGLLAEGEKLLKEKKIARVHLAPFREPAR